MNMYTKDELSCFFTNIDFKMTYFEEHYNHGGTNSRFDGCIILIN